MVHPLPFLLFYVEWKNVKLQKASCQMVINYCCIRFLVMISPKNRNRKSYKEELYCIFALFYR